MTHEKHWYESKTIWGSLIAVASSLTGTLGLSLDTGSQEEMAEAAVGLVGAMGAIVAIFGRVSATRTII